MFMAAAVANCGRVDPEYSSELVSALTNTLEDRSQNPRTELETMKRITVC